MSFFKKTTEKVEKAVDNTEKGVSNALDEAKKLINDSGKAVAVVSTLAIGFLVLGITSSIVNLVVSAKTLERLRTQEILEKLINK